MFAVGELVYVQGKHLFRHYEYTMPSRPECWHFVDKQVRDKNGEVVRNEDGTPMTKKVKEPIVYPPIDVGEEICCVLRVYPVGKMYMVASMKDYPGREVAKATVPMELCK